MKVGSTHAQCSVMHSGAVVRHQDELTLMIQQQGGVGTSKQTISDINQQERNKLIVMCSKFALCLCNHGHKM
jgi:hypothetical protein